MIWILWMSLVLSGCGATEENPEVTYADLYQWGKNEYTAGKWHDCIAFMRRALEDYRFEMDEVKWCRQLCRLQLPPFSTEDGPQIELAIFHRFAERGLCLLRCKLDRLGSLRPQKPPDIDLLTEFDTRKPYHYLQFCYWKLGDLSNAVKAAYTFLIANPEDDMTRENLRFYVTQPGYSADMAVDLEQKPYQKLYLEGVDLYHEEDWMGAIDRLERSLEEYWAENERCRLDCQEATDFDVFDGPREVDVFITSQHAAVLRCIGYCVDTLGTINGNKISNLLPSHYHYLQYAYYKANRARKACQAVADYLLLLPDDETMAANKEFYRNTFNAQKEDLFIPSQNVIKFYRQTVLEKRALAFVDNRFRFVDGLLVPETVDDREAFRIDVPEVDIFDEHELIKSTGKKTAPVPSPLPQLQQQQHQGEQQHQQQQQHSTTQKTQTTTVRQQDVWSTGEEEREKGVDRDGFVSDQLLSADQCLIFSRLQPLTEEKDCQTEPLSANLTLDRLVELIERDVFPVQTAAVLLDTMESVRSFVQSHFNLQTSPFFRLSHLQSSSALPDVTENWDCVKVEKAAEMEQWSPDDYIVVVYLNDNFVGGHFVFKDEQGEIKSEIEPLCGRMMMFSGDRVHGWNTVDEGTRCTFTMYLTTGTAQELDRISAQQRLAQLQLQ